MSGKVLWSNSSSALVLFGNNHVSMINDDKPSLVSIHPKTQQRLESLIIRNVKSRKSESVGSFKKNFQKVNYGQVNSQL